MNAMRQALSAAARSDAGSPGGFQLLAILGPQGRLSAVTVFLALATQQGGTLLTGLIAFLLLGPSEYGRTASALAFLNIFVALGSVSSSVVVYRMVLMHAQDEAAQYQIVRFVRGAVLCSAVAVTLTVLAALYLAPAGDYLKSGAEHEIAAALFFLIASVVISYQQGYLLARGNLLPLLGINFLILVGTVPAAWWLIDRFGYAGYFGAMALPLAIRGIVLFWREPRPPAEEQPPGQPSHFTWREVLIGFMLPATAAGFTSLPAYWLSTEVLFRVPGGPAALGLIALGISIKQAPILFATSLISSLGRPVFQAFGEGRAEMVALHRRLFRRAIGPMILVALALAMAGTLGYLVIRPAGYIGDAMLVATGLCWVLAVEILSVFVYMPINMGGIMWQSLFFVAIPKDAGLVLASLLAISWFGWPGFMIALVIWYALFALFTIIVCRRNTALAPFYTFRRARARGEIIQ